MSLDFLAAVTVHSDFVAQEEEIYHCFHHFPFYLPCRNGTRCLEKEMATHSSVLAWRIPGTGEPGGLPSMGSHRVGHDWSDLAAAAAAVTYKWQPTPVFLPGESQGRRSLVGCRLWGRTELDTTEVTYLRLLWMWDSPGNNTGVGSHSLFQGIFPTQGSNLGALHCRWILYHLIY